MSMQLTARVAALEQRVKELETVMADLTRIICAAPQPRDTLHAAKPQGKRAPI